MDIPLSILVLEDEDEVARSICAQLREGLSALKFGDSIAAGNNSMPLSGISFVPTVVSTDNLTEARRVYHKGGLDLFIADYKVKEEASSTKASADALSLLKEIKNAGALTPIIGHTAIQDLYTTAVEEKIVDVPIHKKHYDSAEKVVAQGIVLCEELIAYKGQLLNAFYTLKCAAACESPIEKQDLLRDCREALQRIELPRTYPKDYKRAIISLRSVVARLSSVESTAFKLGALNLELIEMIYPLFIGLTQPRFNFSSTAKPALLKLEAAGYQVFMRIDI